MILGFFASWLASFAVYLSTISSFSAFGDSPEFVTAAATLGVPHAPGYPLYTMIAHACTKLPWGTIAWRVNLVSAVFASLAVGLTYMITTYVVRQIFPKLKPFFVVCTSFAGAMILAFSSVFWLNAIVAEVFSLNCFFAALLIYLILVWREKRLNGTTSAKKWFYVFAFTAGFSMTNHYTIGFLLFGFVYLIYRTDKDYLIDWNIILPATAAFVFGLAPFLYLPWSAMHSPGLSWGDPGSWSGFWQVVSRGDFKKPLTVASGLLSSTGIMQQFPYYLKTTLRHFGWLLLLTVPLFGVLIAGKKQRPLLWFFLILFLISGPLFVIFASGYQTELSLRAAIMERFFLLSEVPLAILLSLGLAWLITMSPQGIGVGLIVLVFFGTFIKAKTDYPFLDQKTVTIFQTYIHTVMSQTPQNSLYISYGDTLDFGIRLFQEVEHFRTDITHVRNNSLSAPWYRKQLKDKVMKLKFPSDDTLVNFGPHWARSELVRANIDNFSNIVISLVPSPETKRDFRLLPVFDGFMVQKYQMPLDIKTYLIVIDQQFGEVQPLVQYFHNRKPLYERISSYPYLAWEIILKDRLVNSLLQEGIFLLENDQAQASLKFLLQSYELEPGFYSASNLGLAYVKTKDFTQAEKYFMQALQFKPDDKHIISELEHLKALFDSTSP